MTFGFMTCPKFSRDLLTLGPFMTCDAKKFWGLTYCHTFYDDGIWEIGGLADYKPPISQPGHLGRSNQNPKIWFWTISNRFVLKFWSGFKFWNGDWIRLTKQIDLWLTYFMTFRFMTLKFRLDLLKFFLWRMTPDGLRGLTYLSS